MTKAQHKEHQTHAVAKKADRCRGRKGCDLGKWRATTECQRKIDRTGHQPLDHRNLQRIGRTELAGKIVVDAPRGAGKNDQHTTPVELWARDAAFRP